MLKAYLGKNDCAKFILKGIQDCSESNPTLPLCHWAIASKWCLMRSSLHIPQIIFDVWWTLSFWRCKRHSILRFTVPPSAYATDRQHNLLWIRLAATATHWTTALRYMFSFAGCPEAPRHSASAFRTGNCDWIKPDNSVSDDRGKLDVKDSSDYVNILRTNIALPLCI